MNNKEMKELIKTKWKNNFNKEQLNQMLWGLEDNLDVSLYAKPEFNEYQMLQVRLGLEENLDVSIYAKEEFNVWQMEEIRLKLLKESTLK